MSEFTLDSDELAFLLTLVNATAVPGVNLSPLFPPNDTERNAILERGSAALQAHGYMRVVNGYFEGLPTVLPLAVSVLAAPEQLMFTHFPAEVGMVQIGHYVAQEIVVEFYPTPDDRYQLVVLDTVDTAIARIAMTLDVNGATATTPVTLTLPQGVLTRTDEGAFTVMVEPLTTHLTATGLSADDGHLLIEGLSDSARQATVMLAHGGAGAVQVHATITLLPLTTAIAMLITDATGATTLTAPANAAFTTTVRDGIEALHTVKPIVAS